MKRRVLLFGAFALIIFLLGSRIGLFKESQVVSNPVELKPEGVSDRDWSHFLQAHDIRKASNREIRFFGKVVDQHGNPIEGVEMPTELVSRETSLLKVMSNGKDQNTERRTFKTDVNGLFFIGNKVGFALSIKDFIKEGYVRPRRVETTYMFGQIMKDPNSSEFHKADSKKPVTYVMWKKGEAEPLIKTGVRLGVDEHNSPQTLYFPFVFKGEPSISELPNWDVKMTGYNNGGKDWMISLIAKGGGGVILTKDIHTNLAPESGYINELKFTSKTVPDAIQHGIKNVKVYYKSDGGERYAAFDMSYSRAPNKGDSFGLYLRNLRINPAGSRNLEYDKSKRIRK